MNVPRTGTQERARLSDKRSGGRSAVILTVQAVADLLAMAL